MTRKQFKQTITTLVECHVRCVTSGFKSIFNYLITHLSYEAVRKAILGKYWITFEAEQGNNGIFHHKPRHAFVRRYRILELVQESVGGHAGEWMYRCV